MSEIIEMLCLANSRKLGGRCIAGLRTDGGGWIRPVGVGEKGIVGPAQYRINHYGEVWSLDVVRMGTVKPVPCSYQPENVLLTGKPWLMVNRPADRETALPLINAALAHDAALLGNTHDRVGEGALLEASLAILFPEDVRWRIQTGSQGKRQTRAVFLHTGTEYALSVTDPVIERRLQNLPEGDHDNRAAWLDGKCLLFTISLGEPFAGFCYKLVAGVIVLPQDWRR